MGGEVFALEAQFLTPHCSCRRSVGLSLGQSFLYYHSWHRVFYLQATPPFEPKPGDCWVHSPVGSEPALGSVIGYC